MAIDVDDLPTHDERDDQPRDDTARMRGWIVRGVVIAAFLAFLQLTAPEVLSASTSSFDAFARVFGLIVGFLVWSAVVDRLVPNRWARLALVTVPAVVVSVWALRPYYVDEVVNDDFPVAVGTSGDDATAGTDDATDTDTVDSPPDTTTDAPADATRATPPPPPTEPPAPAEPVAVRSGGFQGLTGHRGNGTATVYDLGDGTQVLRLEDFDVSNGPGLELHLVPAADARRPGDGTKVADLRGNQGNQNYDVPAGIDLSSGDWTVLIWCDPFSVEVANATLG